MLIQVTEFVRIAREDERNWTLQTMRIGTTGKSRGREIWSNSGYYGSIGGVVAALLDDKIDLIIDEPDRMFDDLREFQDVMQCAHAKVARAMKGTGRKLAKKAKENGDDDES